MIQSDSRLCDRVNAPDVKWLPAHLENRRIVATSLRRMAALHPARTGIA